MTEAARRAVSDGALDRAVWEGLASRSQMDMKDKWRGMCRRDPGLVARHGRGPRSRGGGLPPGGRSGGGGSGEGTPAPAPSADSMEVEAAPVAALTPAQQPSQATQPTPAAVQAM